MRHELRKPNKLTSHETSTRVEQLNTWFGYFPDDGADHYAALTKLTSDELREIFNAYFQPPGGARWRKPFNSTALPKGCAVLSSTLSVSKLWSQDLTPGTKMIPKRANPAKRSLTDIHRAIPNLGKLIVAEDTHFYPNGRRITLSMAKHVAIPATSARH